MRRPILGALVLSLSALGCLGNIGDPPGGKGSGYDPNADPGRVTLHRLNRLEYNNTVRDLLGTTLTPADDFPADDRGYGFDNIADVLSVSPLQLELYERAAEALAKEAMAVITQSQLEHVEAETLAGSVGVEDGGAWNLYTSGELPFTYQFPSPGTYKVSARVWGQQAGAEPARMNLLVAGQIAGTFDVTATDAAPQVVSAEATVTGGTQVVSVEFLNDFYDDASGADRNLLIDWIEVEGPLGVAAENPIRERILVCDPATGQACVRQIIETFATRAYRRPLAAEEVDRLVALSDLAVAQGDPVDKGLEVAIQAVLTSPHFVFRVEIDPDPTSMAPHPLDDHEIASRLSYFLWSSMPDDALFAAAKEGRLQDPGEIEIQVARMLEDPRSDALVESFAGQWLYTRSLSDHQPDYQKFPDWDEGLREAMRAETQRFFREFLHGDMPVSDMLDADFTYLDDRLAAHYGLPSPGPELTRVTLDDPSRGGILTQGSVLTVTSYPTRTSPVKRGKWILTQLLCDEPPPPPPGVEGLKNEEVPTGSVRDRLEQHRADPTCASCHAVMDPLGFGLEHYDGIGAWRTDDQGFPIDATGQLPTGEAFDGAVELGALLRNDPRFGKCVVEKLYTYALGRGPERTDAPYLDHLSEELGARGDRLKDLVALIATSEPFRMRRGESEGGQQ